MLASILVAFAALFALARGSGEFAVLHTPPGIKFVGNEPLNLSSLKEIYSAALGFTPSQKPRWHGLLTRALHHPEAVVAVALEGVDSFGDSKSIKYPLDIDEDEEFSWQFLRRRLEERSSNNTFVRIEFKDGVNHLGTSALGELKTVPIDESVSKPLSLKNDVDRKFLEEMQLLKAIAVKISSITNVDNVPDIYWFVVSSLGKVSETYGKDSPAAIKGLDLLKEALHELSEAFKESYKNEVLITAFSSNSSQIRQTRSLRSKREVDGLQDVKDTAENKLETSTSSERTTEYEPKVIENDREHEKFDADENEKIDEKHPNTDTETLSTNTSLSAEEMNNKNFSNTRAHFQNKIVKIEKLNVYKGYSEDFPVIFNICFWFVVVFFFSLLAICITIAEMDPGRDSIIYRMTSNRMKKDN